MNELATLQVKLRGAIANYQSATGKTAQEVIEKRTKSLSIVLYRMLRDARTKSPDIRRQMYQLLATHEGVRVRESMIDKAKRSKVKKRSINGKLLNWWQVAVGREISARSSAGGFIAHSVNFKAGSGSSVSTVFSRYAKHIATMTIKDTMENPVGSLSWPGLTTTGSKAVEGLSKEKQQKIMSAAIISETSDVEQYVDRLLQSRYNTIAAMN